MLRIMTKQESEAHEAGLDQWWLSLDSGLKGRIRDLIWETAKVALDLPTLYAEDFNNKGTAGNEWTTVATTQEV